VSATAAGSSGLLLDLATADSVDGLVDFGFKLFLVFMS
jgi:hypothetical protein